VIGEIVAAVLIYMGVRYWGKADISSYGDELIQVEGLTDEIFNVTPNELAEMDCVSDVAVGQTEKAGTVRAYGPTLETFVENYGRTLDEFYSIEFIAYDGYTSVLGKATWDKYEVILSIADGNQPLEDWRQPMRVVIPGADSGRWIYGVGMITFTDLSEVE
ncbi:MAG: hypothetical protein LUD72_12270, partial [Bacteroidales bacterium]|nr:hypothetical protein [Bacteroidales bacterium]